MMETRFAYLIHLLAWTLPVIAGQLFLLRRTYGPRTGAVLRAVLLPATMKLLGRWNWYLPSWLGWLPRLDRERPSEPARTGEPDVVAA